MQKSVLHVLLLLVFILAACQPVVMVDQSAEPMEMHDENIVLGIISSPATANGIVADNPIGINILLNAPGADDHYFSDPAHFGHQIPAGGWMEIKLGGTYIRNGVDNDAEFVPIDSNFNLILLAGNPQNTIAEAAGDGPQHGNYTIEDDGERTITIRPNGGEGDNGLEGARAQEIGLKVIHVLSTRGSNVGPAPFWNGAAGTEGTISIHIYAADGTILEAGEASVEFQESVGRQLFPINFGLATPMQFSPDVATELIETTNFQRIPAGTQLTNTKRGGGTFSAGAPYAPHFLIMEAIEGQPDPYGPMVGVPGVGIIIDADTPSVGALVQDANGDGLLDESDTVVGQVTISGPSAESSGMLLDIPEWPLTTSGNGVEGPPGSFFDVPVELGAEAGIYEVTVSLDGGGQATIFLVVEG